VIGVESLDVPVQKDGALDCGVTRWTENNAGDLPYAFALRVFYNAEINGRLYGCDKCHIGQRSKLSRFYLKPNSITLASSEPAPN